MEKRVHVGVVTKQCEKCGTDVTRKNSAFKDHVFCGRTCYLTSDYFIGRRDASNARRFDGKREERPCRNCGAAVERPISQFKDNVYCARACKKAYTAKSFLALYGYTVE